MPDIRMVWFDIGRVLYDHFADELFEDLAAHSNSSITPHKVYEKILASELVMRYDRGEMPTSVFAAELQNLLGLSVEQRWIEERWRLVLAPNARMWRLATRLRKNGYHLGIISNIGELHIEYIENAISSGTIMQFRPRIYSCREGVDKPNYEIYRIARAKANREYPHEKELVAEECVFIDDRPENVAAAEELGWHAIHHNPVFITRTLLKLADLGVKV